MSMPVIVSGMRPTGPLHIGHYLGVLENWVRLQGSYQCYYFVADWHALSPKYENPAELGRYSVAIVRDWLAAGLDPARTVIFRQSDVLQHAELNVLLGMLTPLGWLERVPSYKEMQQQLDHTELATYGFLGYPLLQAADIVLYKANAVPVGEDQVPHLEFTREVVRRFHHLYSADIFPEPKPLLSVAPRLRGTDGRKMSKSYGNTLDLDWTAEQTTAKIKPMKTDERRKTLKDPGEPDDCPVFDYHKVVTPEPERQELAAGCRSAAFGCMHCKMIMAKNLNERLAPMRERRDAITESVAREVLQTHAARARDVAEASMAEVRRVVGLSGS